MEVRLIWRWRKVTAVIKYSTWAVLTGEIRGIEQINIAVEEIKCVSLRHTYIQEPAPTSSFTAGLSIKLMPSQFQLGVKPQTLLSLLQTQVGFVRLFSIP